MKKLIFSIVFCLVIIAFEDVSASSLDYNLVMDKNHMCHETVVYNIEKNTSDSYLKEILNNDVYFDIDNNSLYDKRINTMDNNVIVTLQNDYNCSEIINSKLINDCFAKAYLEVEKSETYFSAISPFYCTNKVNKMSITFETDVNVIDSNALKDGNKYIWDEIDEELYISMEIANQNKKNVNNLFLFVPVVLIGLVLSMLMVMRAKNKKNNNNFYDF